MSVVYVIQNSKGERIEGTKMFSNMEDALMYLEGMRDAGVRDCYIAPTTH